MPAGDMADRIGHGQYGQAEGERDPEKADAQRAGKAAANTAAPQPPKTSQNVPKNSATTRFIVSLPIDSSV